KLYDLPTITLKDPTMVSFNKGTQILSNWFIARDSFGLIVSSFEVIEGDISTPGNLSVKVTTIDIAGHKKEVVFTYLVLETYEITLIDGKSVEKIILNEQEILTYILPTKEMNHYEFVGWFMEDELVLDIHNVKSNTTLN